MERKFSPNEVLNWMRAFFTDIDITPAMEKQIRYRLEGMAGEPPKERVVYVDKVIEREVVKYVKLTPQDFIPDYRKIDVVAKKIPLEEIAKAVCEVHKITIEQLKINSPFGTYKCRHWKKGDGSRNREYVDARKHFCVEARSIYPYRLSELAQFLGYRDHTSVIHLLRRRKDNHISVEREDNVSESM